MRAPEPETINIFLDCNRTINDCSLYKFLKCLALIVMVPIYVCICIIAVKSFESETLVSLYKFDRSG